MKKYIAFCLFIVVVPSFFASAQNTNRAIPAEIANAFSRAGLPILRQRINPIDFTLPLLSGGNVTLSSLRGQVVFLNFWATWCPPCREEMPSMEALHRRFKDQGLEIIAVNIQENRNQVGAFVREYNLTFPIPLDTSGAVSRRYGMRGIPTTYIIDREGSIILVLTGGLDWYRREIISAFEVLLNHGR